MKTLRYALVAVAAIVAASSAHAQRGIAHDGGRLPETMFPGVQPPTSLPEPSLSEPSMSEPRMSAPVERYPDTEMFSNDRTGFEGEGMNGMTSHSGGIEGGHR